MKIEIIRQITLSLDENEWETVLAGLDALGYSSTYEVAPDMKERATKMHEQIHEELRKFSGN